MILRTLSFLALCLLGALSASPAIAIEDQIADIEIRNIKRIDTDLVFTHLPIKIGDSFSEENIAQAVKGLYRSGYFDDILVSREGNLLVIEVVERPTIRDLIIEGNKLIKDKDLLQSLERSNIARGEILRRDTIDRVVSELEQVYGTQGRYGTTIEATTEDSGDLLVVLQINIVEADPALIASINIIGNNAFTDDELIEGFESNQRDFWTTAFSWAYDANAYAGNRLAGDLQRLRDLYFEHGYVDFTITSTDVAISNDYRNVYVSITVEEGNQYQVGEVSFSGELIGSLANYTRHVTLQPGDTYLASSATATELAVTSMLEDLGYGFADVQLQLDSDRPSRTVNLNYLVKPGKRLYIRRISFVGNVSTTEEALRRELRIFEGGWFSNAKIIESKARLSRLGFFSSVNHRIINVPGVSNQVDVEFSTEDVPTGHFAASITHSNLYGAGIGLTVTEKNVAGTGNPGAIQVSINNRLQRVNLNWQQSYINFDGASLAADLTYYRVNFEGTDIANYASSVYSVGASLSYPIDQNWRLSYGGELSRREIGLGSSPIVEIVNFTEKYSKQFNIPAVRLSLSQNTYNTGFMPTKGRSQQFSFYSTLGIDSLHFYRLGYNFSYYQPLESSHQWVYRPTLGVGYGRTWDTSQPYPFLYNYYAGGYGTVRGFDAGSLGPKATTSEGQESGSLGGNILLRSSHELVFPLWYHTERTRFLFFYDIGNVYTNHCEVASVEWCIEGVDTSELRQSVGFTIEWYTLVGPLVFIIPRTLNAQPGDRTNNFEFSLGRVF